MKRLKIRKCWHVRCKRFPLSLPPVSNADFSIFSDLFQRRIKMLEAHLKDSSTSSRTGSVIGTPVSRTDRSPMSVHDRPVESVSKWREDIPHEEPHIAHEQQSAMTVPSSQKGEDAPDMLPQRQEISVRRAETTVQERVFEQYGSTSTGHDPFQEGSSRFSRQVASSRVLAEESLAPPVNVNTNIRQPQISNTVEDDVEMQVLDDSADEHMDYEAEPIPAERSVIEISSRRTVPSVQQRQALPDRPISVPPRPPSPIRTEQRRPIAVADDDANMAEEILGSSPVARNSPKRGNAQLPITTPAARQPVAAVVPGSKRSAPVLAPAARPPPPPEPKFAWSSEVKRVLKDTFGLQSFRSNQKEAINTTMKGEDVFVLMPTGGGKSLCCKPNQVSSRGYS
jgi:hypothetical protein